MRITINEISADGTVVQFTHDRGRLDGVWRGNGAPALGAADVHVDVPGRYWWEDDIRIRDGRRTVISLDPADHALPLIGEVVVVDDAGVLTLQVGDDQVHVQTAGKVPAAITGQTVEVDGALIELAPAAR